ncbi:MAG: OmpH family outer membrane protein [Myxococcota bacterium]
MRELRLLGCLFTLWGAVLAGCQREEVSRVAVVDLARLSSELGQDSRVERLMVEEQREQLGKLEASKAELTRRLEESSKVLGPHPTPEQKQAHQALKEEFQHRLDVASEESRRAVELKRKQLKDRFREDVRTVARRLGAAKGIQLIVLSGDQVLDHDPAIDITGLVLAEMRQAQSDAPPTGPAPLPPPEQRGPVSPPSGAGGLPSPVPVAPPPQPGAQGALPPPATGGP